MHNGLDLTFDTIHEGVKMHGIYYHLRKLIHFSRKRNRLLFTHDSETSLYCVC